MHLALFTLLVVGFMFGCKGKTEHAVSGTITQGDQPLPKAVIRFLPVGETKGLGGSALTDDQGKYTLLNAKGEKSIFPGEYRVVISKRLNKDGTEPDPNAPPIESTAAETLPPEVSDENKTTLAVTVKEDQQTYDFPLPAKKR